MENSGSHAALNLEPAERGLVLPSYVHATLNNGNAKSVFFLTSRVTSLALKTENKD
jgi:hypothetical protein